MEYQDFKKSATVSDNLFLMNFIIRRPRCNLILFFNCGIKTLQFNAFRRRLCVGTLGFAVICLTFSENVVGFVSSCRGLLWWWGGGGGG